MKKYIFLLFLGVLGMSSCTTSKSLYSWYQYDDATHAFTKNQTEESEKALVDNFDKIINHQRGTRKVVPPGIYAERGYYFLKSGKTTEALDYFNKEKKLYPESAVFMDRIIKRMEK